MGTHFQISYGRVLNSLFQHPLPNRVPSAITSQSPLSFPITLLLHDLAVWPPHTLKNALGVPGVPLTVPQSWLKGSEQLSFS